MSKRSQYPILLTALLSFSTDSYAGDFAGTTHLLLCPSFPNEFQSGSDVIEAEASNFQRKVIDTGQLTLVSFYAPWSERSLL